MRTILSKIIPGVLGLTLITGGATELQAQEVQSWTWTAMGGVLDFDFANENFPLFAMRGDREISKWVRFELESSVARVEVQTDGNGFFAPSAPEEHSTLGTVSIGFQARYKTEYVEPYAGLSFGLFFRRDSDGDGVRSSQSTIGFPVGLRVFLTDRLGLRGEVRMRRDQTAFGISTDTNWERTLGVSWTF